MGVPTTGALSRYAFDVALPFDTSSKPLEVTSCTLGKQGSILSTDGIRGTRQYHSSRTRTGTYRVSGSLVLPVTPLVLDYFLPYILGKDESTDVFDPGEPVNQFYLLEYDGLGTFTFSDIAVARATFSGSKGGLLSLSMDLEAQTEAFDDEGTFPALTAPSVVADGPYAFTDGVLTLQGGAEEFAEFELVIDNELDTEKFENSLTRTGFPSAGQIVTLRTDHPWTTDEAALYDQAYGGAAGTLVFTNADTSGTSLTIAFGRLQAPAERPGVNGRGEKRLGLNMVARQMSTSPSVRFTNVHTLD